MLTWIVVFTFFVALSESPNLSMMLSHFAKHRGQTVDSSVVPATFPLVLVFAAPLGTMGMIVWIVWGIASWIESFA
jgi:hypothetical protein